MNSTRIVGTPSSPPPGRVVPKAPFDDWPIQHEEPNLGYYWYTAPSVLIVQSTTVNGSLEAIKRHNDVVDKILSTRQQEVRSNGGLFLLLDWRSLQSYDEGARASQQERMRAREDGYARQTVVVLKPANKLLRMAVSAANLFTTMLSRSAIEIASSPEPILSRHGFEAPTRGTPFYGRE